MLVVPYNYQLIKHNSGLQKFKKIPSFRLERYVLTSRKKNITGTMGFEISCRHEFFEFPVTTVIMKSVYRYS